MIWGPAALLNIVEQQDDFYFHKNLSHQHATYLCICDIP